MYNISNTSKFLNIESLYLLLHHNSKFVTFDIRIIIINLFNYRSVKFTFIKRNRTTFILLKYLSVLISINLNFNQSSFKFKSRNDSGTSIVSIITSDKFTSGDIITLLQSYILLRYNFFFYQCLWQFRMKSIMIRTI
jgi:hypothetical protein